MTLVWITPELALGPALPCEQLRRLTKAGIGSVLDVRSEACDDEGELSRRGLRFFHVPVDDFQAPSQEQLEAATNWTLAEIGAGRKVYLHCRSGIGRSPSVACAVLMAIGYPLQEAYRTVRRERPRATFSGAQQAALEEFERRLQERRAASSQRHTS